MILFNELGIVHIRIKRDPPVPEKHSAKWPERHASLMSVNMELDQIAEKVQTREKNTQFPVVLAKISFHWSLLQTRAHNANKPTFCILQCEANLENWKQPLFKTRKARKKPKQYQIARTSQFFIVTSCSQMTTDIEDL